MRELLLCQSDNVRDFLNEKGIETQGTSPLEYVKIYGALCKDFELSEGESISEETFSNLLQGKDKEGKKRTRTHKIHGIDFTFSAPKTVSIAGLVLKQSNIVKAHQEAVLETMKEIESNLAYAQPKPDVNIKTGKMLYAVVNDGFSRENDPHLHSHVIIYNLTELNGDILALRSHEVITRDVYKTFGALYKSRLAANLKTLM